MTLAFATGVVEVPNGQGRRENLRSSVTFNSNVNEAIVALSGFRLDFGGEDHRIDACEVAVERESISGTTVNFRVRCNFADENANDSYSGSISAIIIADVA